MNFQDNIDEICSVCNREADQECQRCKMAYCSKECQQSDWTRHRFACLPMPYLVKKQNNSMRAPQLTTVGCKRSDSQTNIESTASNGSMFNSQTRIESTVSTGSVFNNPFKKNSKNIGFQSNNVRKNVGNVFDLKSLAPDKNLKKEVPNEIKKIIKESDKNDITQLGCFKIGTPAKVKTLAAAEPIKKSIQSNGVDSVTALTEVFSTTKPKQETASQQREKDHMFTMNDIDIVPLLPGKKLSCLDYSNIEKGYLSVCVFNQKAIDYIVKLSVKITEYCQRTNETFCPQENELCLCRYKEDGQWYRAVVERVIDSNTFEIEFFDFGNKASVKCADIRKMPKEFTHHSLTNKCYLKNFPQNPVKDELIKMAIFFDENTIFDAKALDEKNGRYVIEVEYQ